MMEKKIASNADEKPVVVGSQPEEPQAPSLCDPSFPVGGRFYMAGKIWRVTESRYEDNTQMRRVQSSLGDDAIFTLKSLQDDIKGANFKFMEEDEIGRALRVQAESKKNRRR